MSEHLSLFVVERGGPPPATSGGSIVIAQRPDESASDLVLRTASFLSELLGRGGVVDDAILACNGSTDAGAQSARAKLADLLLESIARSREPKLILTARE